MALSLTYVFVTSGNNRNNAGISEGFDSTVDGLGEGSAQGHVHNSLSANILPLNIVNDELHAVQHTGVATTAIGIKDLDCHEVDLLRNTESETADRASDVATMAILVFVL